MQLIAQIILELIKKTRQSLDKFLVLYLLREFENMYVKIENVVKLVYCNGTASKRQLTIPPHCPPRFAEICLFRQAIIIYLCVLLHSRAIEASTESDKASRQMQTNDSVQCFAYSSNYD